MFGKDAKIIGMGEVYVKHIDALTFSHSDLGDLLIFNIFGAVLDIFPLLFPLNGSLLLLLAFSQFGHTHITIVGHHPYHCLLFF